MRAKTGAALLAAGLAVPAAALAAGDWRPVAPEALTPSQAEQRSRAEAAREAMFQRLMTRLKTAMEAEGPSGAIEVCRKEAPEIAKQVRKEHGLKIGRTSFKLRNPRNSPPRWARPDVRQRTAEPRFLAHPDGRLAALLPIRLKQECLKCHGDPTTMPAEVKEVLERRYPGDQATGFREGDLRGWFWVEVPARK